jgi:hypothetical protein
MVAGDLDSNEYTTVDFEAIPTDGEISLNIIYSDSLNKRRTIKKNLGFDSSYFTNRANGEEPTSKSTYVLWAVLVLGLIYWFRKRKK